MKIKNIICVSLLTVLLAGCFKFGKNNSDTSTSTDVPSSYDLGWKKCSKDEAEKRLNSAAREIDSEDYRIFNKKLTINTIYLIRSEETSMDDSNQTITDELVYKTSYKYNPDVLSFEYIYEIYDPSLDSSSFRTILMTTGRKNGKNIIQVKTKYPGDTEFEISNNEIENGTTPRQALENKINDFLFYFGLNMSYYINNLDYYTTDLEATEGATIKSQSLDVVYSSKNSDGVRIESKQSIEEFKKDRKGQLLNESTCSNTCDFMMMDNIILKGQFKSQNIVKDYNERIITKDIMESSVATVEKCDLNEIEFVKNW